MRFANLAGGLAGLAVDAGHDLVQPGVDLLEAPLLHRRVLAHFQLAGGHAAGIGRLARAVQDAGVEEAADGFLGGRHIGAFGDQLAAVVQQLRRIVTVQFVLRRARESGVTRYRPDRIAARRIVAHRHEAHSAALLGIAGQRCVFDFLDLFQQGEIDTGRVVDEAGRITGSDRSGTTGLQFLDGVDGHIAGAGDDAGFAFQRLPGIGQHLTGEVHRAIAGGFLARQRPAPVQSLAGQHAFVAAGQALVLAEQVADFARANADVAGRHVDGRADMAVQLAHERLAEAHDLIVGLALRIEVGPALAATDGQPGQRVLEDLLEAEELDHAGIHARVEAQAALVRADGRVELDPVALVDLHFATVVDPGDAEHDLPFRLDDARHDIVAAVFRIGIQ